MLYEVMNSINNHFVNTVESKKYNIVPDGIESESNFIETYLPGQYILIKGSRLNDGVYKVSSFNSNKITVEETLQAENIEVICIYGLSIPKTFLNLVNEIETWISKNSCALGVASEKIDDYGINYTAQGSSGWKEVFTSQLCLYRKLYSDLNSCCNNRW